MVVQRALEIQHRVEPDALIAAAAPERERFLGRERAQRLAQRDRQPRRLVGLEHVIDVLGLICVHEIARVARQEDHAAGGRETVDLLGECNAVHVRHADIQHGNIRMIAFLLERDQHGIRALKRLYTIRYLPQRSPQDLHRPVKTPDFIITHCNLKHSPAFSFFLTHRDFPRLVLSCCIVYQTQKSFKLFKHVQKAGAGPIRPAPASGQKEKAITKW